MKRGKLDTLSLTKDPILKEIIDALWRDKVPKNINVEWNPGGILFSAEEADPNVISWIGGQICIHEWNRLSESDIKQIGRDKYHPERWWDVGGLTYTVPTDGLYYVFAAVPKDEELTTANIIITDLYEFEERYVGYVYVLMGIITPPNPRRTFSMLWNGLVAKPAITEDELAEEVIDELLEYLEDVIVNVKLELEEQIERSISQLIRVYRAIPTGDVDGVNCFFDLPEQIIEGTEEVFLNGVLQNANGYASYTITEGLNPTRITFGDAPRSDEVQTDFVLVNYSYYKY